MKAINILLVLACTLLSFGSFCQSAKQLSKSMMLPNGWSLSPYGQSLELGDLPLNMATSPDQKYLIVTNNGQSKNSIQLIDLSKNQLLDAVEIDKAWYGLVFVSNNSFYASGGNDNWLVQYQIVNEHLIPRDTIVLGAKWPNRISPTGLCYHKKNSTLYAVTKDNYTLYEINLKDKKINSKINLPAEAYMCAISASEKEVYISIWGKRLFLIYNIEKKQITDSILVGAHPNEFCITKNGRYVFIANGEDNSVSVIDTKKKKVIETLNVSLFPNAPTGSGTNGLALNEDQNTLYIANADNNCLAVYDVTSPGNSVSKGFIPVGWYPTNVKIVHNKLYVTNGKGLSSFPNQMGPDPYQKNAQLGLQKGLIKSLREVQYIGGLMKGTLSYFDCPNADMLGLLSQQVYQNTPYSKTNELLSNAEPGSVIPQKVGDTSPIKYVFYIVKENRTYDQVLGDLPMGNGDTSLCLFGASITPNIHALVKEFVLLDNFYVDGEVSADGHNWTMGAYANDYLEKNWVTSYGGRGGTYDAEGTRSIANNKDGFIWDFAKRAGVSYRTYGEFADDYKANLPVLENHFCPYFTSWDQSVRDTTRVRQWERDFDSLLAINQVPQLNTLRLINDHTEGLQLGRPSPKAHVADNDLAVGMFIDYLSKSKIWNKSVVFILEDDAQDGPDHVDAHRSTAIVAGGFVKRDYIDHTMYSTSSMLKTIELILGMPPMSQYDAGATAMWRCFDHQVNNKVFNALPLQYDINEKNTKRSKMQEKSESFNFKKEDRVNDREFNEVLWTSIKGEHIPMPQPKRAAFVKLNSREDKND